MSALADRFETAIKLATEAAQLALQMRPPPGASSAKLKGAQDWLTEADGAVERLLSERLAHAHPADGFQGEEGGHTRSGSLRWVVDPIDGTANFMRGAKRFCVSLGCLDRNMPVLGVIVAPALEETFAACHGMGATLNGEPIRASETGDLTRATVELGWSRRRPREAFLSLADNIIAAGAMPRLNGSGALGLADVAAGRSDAYIELHINLWDVAAGLAILDEAGAVVSPFMAGDGATAGNPILAAAPGIATKLSSVTQIPL
ncbi:MAG TPA: inositol monophosphatase family protein [Acetobacteraceae bacterium]|jgi:myo-inositol-1(or 4)-monophosphatase|nr:inositol monophosphatase family protein [Acetobacteraceae bacterium]